MDYKDTRNQFIMSWGELGVRWGVSKTMAQIHALLLINCEPLSYDEIIAELDISRGNAHNNTHNLLEWDLIYKVEVDGEKKDYFIAEKDVHKIFQRILVQRKKEELDPLINQLKSLSILQPSCKESRELKKIINDLSFVSEKADLLLNIVLRSDIQWLMSIVGKMVR